MTRAIKKSLGDLPETINDYYIGVFRDEVKGDEPFIPGTSVEDIIGKLKGMQHAFEASVSYQQNINGLQLLSKVYSLLLVFDPEENAIVWMTERVAQNPKDKYGVSYQVKLNREAQIKPNEWWYKNQL